MKSNSQFEFVPRYTQESKFLDLVNVGDTSVFHHRDLQKDKQRKQRDSLSEIR